MTDEKQLVQAALSGDSRSFERLVEKYQSMICAITFSATGRMETSEELAQETFFRAWKNLAQLKDIDKFRFWLCSIARNLLRTYYQQKHSEKVSVCDTDTLETLASPSVQSPADTLISREEEMMLNQALMQIPEEYREPLVLFYRQQQSTREVAESLDLNEATVRTRLSRGRQMLKDQVAGMVERTLEKTGPSKKFTKTVMVAIGAGLAAGTAATATAASVNSGNVSSTAAGGAWAVFTGVGIKVAVIAAAVLIGAGVMVYQYWNPSRPLGNATSTGSVIVQPLLEDTIKSIPKKSIKPQPVTTPDKLSQNSPENKSASSPQDTAAESVPLTKSGTGISGVILDKSTSKPIKNAEIFCGRNSSTSVFSDANGHFELLGMEPMPRQQFYVIAKRYATRTIVTEIIRDKIYQDFKVELIPGSTVAGVVSDPNGNPIEGASVKTFHFTNHPILTDKDGQFEIDGIDPAFGQCQLEAVHPNYPAVNTVFSPASAGQTVFVDFILKHGITVYGKVTNAQGLPVSDVSVGNTTSRAMWNCIQTRTDKEGMYKLKNIPEGDFVLWAVTDQYAPYVEHTVLDSSQPVKLLNIQLADPCPIHGKIIDAQGNPVPGINVCLSEYKGVTNLASWNDRKKSDSEGKFTIPNGPCEGKMILEAFGESIPNTEPEFDAGMEQEYIIKVDRAGRIYGKVLDDRTGEPVGKFNVKLAATTKGTPVYGYSATWDRQGHTFESPDGVFDTGVETIPIGTQYAVTITAGGYDSLYMDPVTVQPISEDPNRTEFKLKTATVISGRVVDCNSMPIAEASIRRLTEKNNLSDFEEHWEPSDITTTDSKGEFTLSGVGSGKCGLYITASNFAPYAGLISNLPHNSQGSVAIILTPGASIFGKVVDPNGHGQVSTRVSVHIRMEQLQQISNSLQYSISTVTDADGYYEIKDLPAGVFSVTVNTSTAQRGYTSALKKIVLETGQSRKLNFGDEQGFTLTGSVRKGKTLLGGADIIITFPDRSSKTTQSDVTGHFVFQRVPAGDYEIDARYNPDSTAGTFQPFPKKELWTHLQVKIKDNTTIDVSFGDSSIKGNIPDSYLNHKELVLRAFCCEDEKSNSVVIKRTRNTITAEIDSQGNYTCQGLHAGRYYLLLEASGQTIAVSDVFELGESQQIENIPLKSGTGRLQIHCVDSETGQDIAGAYFSISNEFGASFHFRKLAEEKDWRMKVNSMGMAEYPDLPAGKYRIKALAVSYPACQSDFFIVNNDTATSATISMDAGAVVRFELSEQVKPLITTKIAYLLCQITNLDTQESVPGTDLYHFGLPNEHLIFLYSKDAPKPVDSPLNLPAGHYEIQYRLYQSEYGFSESNTQPPLQKGTLQVELAKRDTKTLTITQGQ
jgi:RNA polymerase sigma factor (sigma-70 family)